MRLTRQLFGFLAAFLLLLPALRADAQAYTSIVVFGDSLSDTGNDANLSAAKYTAAGQVPGPATGYTNGRFTDGTDTTPAAQKYFGVWVEQLAAQLAAKPPVVNSLASGGTNYAYGYATTDVGTSVLTYGPLNFSINVNNMGLQLSTYLATKPTITNKTLFVVWGGANDLLNATSTAVITQAATREVGIVQQLITAGATDFLVVNLPPLGLVPRFNGMAATSLPATQEALAFDQALAAGLAAVPPANPGKTLHLFTMDTYTLFNTIVGPPLAKGFANVTASSQFTTNNPDTFLFWDDLHPTTFGHSMLAAAALTAIGTPVTTSTTVTSSNLAANLTASVTLTASVVSTSGTPTGTLTFLDGTNVLGMSYVYGSTTTATASLTTSALTAGPHTISASFSGVNGYASSSSPSVQEIVTAPAFNASFASNSITIASGASGTATLNFNPVGGFTGAVTFACGTLPTHFTCSVAPTSVTFPSATTSATVTVGTSSGTARLTPPRLGPQSAPGILAALLIFPGLGCLGFAARRRRLTGAYGRKLLLLSAFLTFGAVLGLSGCGSSTNPNFAPAGTYTVPIVISAGGSSSTVNLTVVVH